MNFGYILDNTEITPSPPKERVGTIWSSQPEYIASSSLQRLAICAT